MENRDYIISLYDLYGSLLTLKQKNYFEDYYYADLSLSEIAENYNISRNGVYDQIKRVESNLCEFEEKLKLYEKISKLEGLDIDEELKEKIINIIKE